MSSFTRVTVTALLLLVACAGRPPVVRPFPSECGREESIPLMTVDAYEESGIDCSRLDYVAYTLFVRGPEARRDQFPGSIYLDLMLEHNAQPSFYAWPWIRNFRLWGEEGERILACSYEHGFRAAARIRFCVAPNRPLAIHTVVRYGHDRLRPTSGGERPLMRPEMLEVRDSHGRVITLEAVSWDHQDGEGSPSDRRHGLHFTNTPPFPGQQVIH